MMIQAVLGNPHHPEYGVATIPFPIPRDQYAHCMELLEALEIGDAVKADCKVEEIDSFYTVLKRTEMLTVNAELENLVFGPRKEFITMAILVLINIPLVRFINKDWYHTLVATIPGQMVIAVCLAAVFVSFAYSKAIPFHQVTRRGSASIPNAADGLWRNVWLWVTRRTTMRSRRSISRVCKKGGLHVKLYSFHRRTETARRRSESGGVPALPR